MSQIEIPTANTSIFISFSLIIYPATVLLVPKVNGLIFGVFAIMGLFFLFIHRKSSMKVSRDESLFYISVGFFFIASLLIALIGGFTYKPIGKFLHLLLAIPVYIYLRHSGVQLFHIWFGLVLGAIVAAGVAIYEITILHLPRARSLTHPIIFGDLALVMGCMAMAGLGWFKQRANLQMFFPILALLCGVFASVLASVRGGWVSLPFLFIILFWYIKSHVSFKIKVFILTAIIVFIAMLYAIPETKVSFNINRTLSSLQQYSDSEITSNERKTSVGGRLEMWQASWKIFIDNPIVGVGWGHYQEHAQLQVDQGLRNWTVARFDHPHSEYFSALAQAGIIGFIALMVLYLTPAWLFIKNIKHGKTVDVRRLALAGLVLIVAYMGFGISEPVLYRSRSVNFFAFYLAIFMAGIYHENKKCRL